MEISPNDRILTGCEDMWLVKTPKHDWGIVDLPWNDMWLVKTPTTASGKIPTTATKNTNHGCRKERASRGRT